MKEIVGNYVCSYDIPEDILDKYEGVGFYYDLFNYSTLYGIVEYAIISNEISLDYLMEIEYIKQDIDVDDYLYNPDLVDFLELRYKRDDLKKLIRIK